jgi:hypothetical protein
MTLSELDILEKEIITRLNDLNAKKTDPEILDTFLSEAFKKYTIIHKAYIDLIKNGDEKIKTEALKRALYIQWIGSFEPSFITGITTSFKTHENIAGGLELKDFQFVYSYVDNLIKNHELDQELIDMLSFYSSWEYVFEFENFKDYKHLHQFIINANPEISYVPLIRMRNLEHRGQMGDYFLS